MQSQQGIPPSLIWILGISLILADSVSSRYWQDVASAVRSGAGVSGALRSAQPYQGIWRLAGGLLLLFLLSLWAQASEGGGVFAVLFLVILWALYLATHQEAVAYVLGRFTKAG